MTNKFASIFKATPPSPPDQRDIPFVPTILRPDFKSSLDLRPNVDEVKNQLSIGSCVAHGVTEQCEEIGAAHGIHLKLSPLMLYTATLDFEGRLGQEGLYSRDALKVGHRVGICLEKDYPYDVTKATVRPTDAAYAAAYGRFIERYEAVVLPSSSYIVPENQERIDRIISALNEGLTVGVAYSVTKSIFSMSGDWKQQQYKLASQDVVVGGHYTQIIGYDLAAGKFLVQNSWGPNWGDGGFGGFPFDIVGEPYFEAWLIRKFNGVEVKEVPGIKFEGLNRFRIQTRIVPEESEKGKKVKIWMGARTPDGKIYLRNKITPDQVGPGPKGVQYGIDNWSLYNGTLATAPSTVDDYILGDENIAIVVQWMNMAALSLSGTEVYVAYGDSQANWKLQKVCTVPKFL